MKTRAAELCGDQCRSIDFQPLPIIPIRCQELAVAVPRGCAHCPRKLSVYGTLHDPAGLWQHAFNRDFNHTLRMASNHLFKGRFFKTTDVATVTVVHFVSTLVASYRNFVSVQNDDVITGIYVRSVFRFVLTAQAQSQFGSQTAQSFTGRVNNIPVAFYGFWFSCKFSLKAYPNKLVTRW